jgi:flagellar basal-body rod modification protein FlgD
MNISGVERGAATDSQAQATSTSSSQTSGAASLDYNAFLKLLIAQMQNQDPLEPMKSTDYVAQLATFSQVEKTVQTNERISDLLTAVKLQQAESLIGRDISNADGSISGSVTSARISGQDVIAMLADGREVTLNSGITISRGAAA